MTQINTISADVIDMALALSMELENKDIRIGHNFLVEFRKAHGINATIDSGAYRYAFIMNGGVIKMSNSPKRYRALRDECNFINMMRLDPRWGRHFPETYEIASGSVPVLVQERIDMDMVRPYTTYYNDVIALGEALGIDDVHSGNYGWKGPRGQEYPVFIDVDLRINRRRPRARRSWMV